LAHIIENKLVCPQNQIKAKKMLIAFDLLISEEFNLLKLFPAILLFKGKETPPHPSASRQTSIAQF